MDGFGSAYVTGWTYSSDFPAEGEYQTYKSYLDIFVTKIAVAATCCWWRVGDVNGLGGDEPTIGDVSTMIDALFISGDPNVIMCLTEADINRSGGPDPLPSDITISYVSTLIDYLFITGPSLGLLKCL